jgi:transcriptional regulator with XRE-family HTH domain
LANKKSNTLLVADKKILKAVGSKIRQIREKKNQSVYDITGDDLLIKSRQHWQSIENGQKNINVTTIFKIAKTLGVKAEDLIKDL